MRVMLVSSRKIVLLQCTVQDLWNIAWISTSHARSSLRMRTLATEFSNCDWICKNPICLCKPTVATVAMILQPVECNKCRVNLQDAMGGMFTGRNGWNVYRTQWVECLQNRKNIP